MTFCLPCTRPVNCSVTVPGRDREKETLTGWLALTLWELSVGATVNTGGVGCVPLPGGVGLVVLAGGVGVVVLAGGVGLVVLAGGVGVVVSPGGAVSTVKVMEFDGATELT